MVITGLGFEQEMIEEAGLIINRTLITMFAFNAIFITYTIIVDVRRKLKKLCYKRRCCHKMYWKTKSKGAQEDKLMKKVLTESTDLYLSSRRLSHSLKTPTAVEKVEKNWSKNSLSVISEEAMDHQKPVNINTEKDDMSNFWSSN